MREVTEASQDTRSLKKEEKNVDGPSSPSRKRRHGPTEVGTFAGYEASNLVQEREKHTRR